MLRVSWEGQYEYTENAERHFLMGFLRGMPLEREFEGSALKVLKINKEDKPWEKR
jgi:hypothetical protein